VARIEVIAVITSLAVLLAGCSATRWSAAQSRSRDAPVDVAIITVLPEEYQAVLRKLENVRPVQTWDGRANAYVWVVGEVPSAHLETARRVVVGMAGESGEVSGALATGATIDRFRPRDVLLVGIAGGVHDYVELGDVVISSEIWGYEHGHLGTRYDSGSLLYFPADPVLLRAARGLGADWRKRIEVSAPDPGVHPRVVEGQAASGNKVIESGSSAYFAQSLGATTAVVAVEMEGAGAAAAVGVDHDLGGTTGFLMIRGVSDLVEIETSPGVAKGGRNPDRDVWKEYAADVAASFAIELIRSSWPDGALERVEACD
jgi:nucleoside phosphorylase